MSRRTPEQSEKLRALIVRIARKKSGMETAKQLKISRSYVTQVLCTHRKRTGEQISGGRKMTSDSVYIPYGTPKFEALGFCLICKCAAPDPADRVPMYVGEGAPVCFACGGSGWYYEEIMRQRVEVDTREMDLCMECNTYRRYVVICEKEGVKPRSRDRWKRVRCDERKRKT